MWIYTVAPEWAIHLLLGIGILGLLAAAVLSFIPFVRQYRLPIQVGAALLTALGLYLQGGLVDNKEWQARVKEMEAKVAAAQIESGKTNVVIQEKVVTKTEVVKERGKDIIKYIDRIKEIPVEVQGPEREKIVEVIKHIETCPVPQLLIDQHNAATILNKATEPKK